LQESTCAKTGIVGKEKVGGPVFLKKATACQVIAIEPRQQNLQPVLCQGSSAHTLVACSDRNAITSDWDANTSN
jgi:hypothetical protein